MNYFITSIDDKKNGRCPDSRTFGYYSTLEKAMEAVNENRCNMHECLYNHLVIEAIGEGIHALCDTEYWYEWRYSGWERLCSKPEQFNGIVNWSIG